MKKYYQIVNLAFIIVPVLFFIALLFVSTNKSTTTNQDPSDVKIIADGGTHGSGVHIGNGYIITAAHVLNSKQDYRVKAKSGRLYGAVTLWKADDYDVALMRVHKPDLASANIDCKQLVVGDELVSKGNPYNLQFLTMRGHVASIVGEIARWHDAIIADISIAPGMSGGPVFNSSGSMVGINVGVVMAPTGLGRAPTGFAIVVPSSAICALLTR